MGKYIKSFFTENLLLKFSSIIFAFLVWLLVVNINNPTQSRNFTTIVEVTNQQVLAEQGKFYTIPEGANTVTFRVTAPRSVIERLSADDFKAVADMAKLEDDSRIPIEITAINHAGSITISNRPYYLTVEIGEEMEEKYIITPEATGEPASGFVISDIKADPNIITIRGPESIVSLIHTVVASCDVTGMNERASENVVPILLDGEGKRVDTTRLSLSQATVNVTVSFSNVKEVPIVLGSADSDNEVVEVESVTINPKTIRIMGDSAILNDITEITIPSSVIDLSTITGDVTTTVDISRYLPNGARLTMDTTPEVKVSIKINTEKTVSLEMPQENISIRNLQSGMQCTFDSRTVRVDVTGLPSALENIKGEDLTGRINLDGLAEGPHTVRVEMDESNEYTIGSVTVKITISKNTANGTIENGDTNNTED